MVAPRTFLVGGQLLLLGLAAFFAARATSGVLAHWLRAPRPPVEIRPADVGPAPEARPRKHFEAIVKHDIFNPPKDEARATAPVRVASTLKAKLLGTAPGTGIASHAIIEDEKTRKQDLYRIGDHIQDRTVSDIQWDHIVLRSDGKEEVLRLEEPTSGGRSPAPGRKAASPPTDSEGIRALSDSSFVIEQAKVDEAMENLNELFTQIRAVPHFQDGQANGFRLFAIRRSSIFDQIGLKNGDIIHSINGNELTDPARAMAMLQDLRGQGNIEVEVTRNREPKTLSYEIR